MSNEKAPREFWLMTPHPKAEDQSWNVHHNYPHWLKFRDDTVHVIEAAPVLAAIREMAAVLEDCEKFWPYPQGEVISTLCKTLTAHAETIKKAREKWKKGKKDYTVFFKVMVETTIDFTAQNYEDALAKAREYGVKDVVEFDTDFNDGSIAIVGVYNSQEEPK